MFTEFLYMIAHRQP